jgi:hypothetical protein
MPEQVLSPPRYLIFFIALVSCSLPLASALSLVAMINPAMFASKTPNLALVLVDVALFLVGTELTVINFRLARGMKKFYPGGSFLGPDVYRKHWWWGKPNPATTALPRLYLKVREIPAFLSLGGLFLLLAFIRELMTEDGASISSVLILLGGCIVILSFFLVMLSPRIHEEIREGSEYVLGEDGLTLVAARDMAGTPALFIPGKREISSILSIMGIFIGISLITRPLSGTGYLLSTGTIIAGISITAIVIGIVVFINGITKGWIPFVAGDWRLLGLQTPVVEGEDRRRIRERLRNPRLKKVELSPARSGLFSIFVPGLGQIYNGESEKGLLLGFGVPFIGVWDIRLGFSFYLFLILDGFFSARRLRKAGRTLALADEFAILKLIALFFFLGAALILNITLR